MVLFEVRSSGAADGAAEDMHVYDCPLYRRISTPGSGRLQNNEEKGIDGGHVMTISIPTPGVVKLHWQLRGVCAALDVSQ